MIKKLQKKFIMITMASLVLVILVLIGTINAINIYQMYQKVDGTIQILYENQGKFPKFEKDKPPIGRPKYGLEINEETPFETRYFIVTMNTDGSIREIDTSHIHAITSNDAAEYAQDILSSNRNSGFKSIYKYEVIRELDGYMLIVIDCRNQIQTATLFLITSFGVAVITLVLMFVLVSIFSKRAIKPIIASMEKQKQFITDAGHEIKTPLAIISANADVLEITGGETEWITSIRNQITRLDRLVKNLLMLSKMDEENLKISFLEFNLSKTVYESAKAFTSVAETQNKTFLVEVVPDVKLFGDETSIQQLVSTLVDNAIKYANDHGTIKVTLSLSKKEVKLEVYNTTDNQNQKLSKENLDKMFDRFYRADSSRSRETGGYGIGLSIAKSIVEAHHGKISVKSEDAKSICFTVRLLKY